MRCDQHAGLTKAATEFIVENRLASDVCPCCNHVLHSQKEKIGSYEGFDSYPLFRYALTGGRQADEFLQAAPWSSGPIFFLGLKVSDGQVFEWTEEEMQEWL